MEDMPLEVEALASLAASARVAASDAVEHLDESFVGVDDFAHPAAARMAGVLVARIRERAPLEYVTVRSLLRFEAGSAEAKLLQHVLLKGSPNLAREQLSLVHGAATRRRCVDSLRTLAGVLRDEGRSVSTAVSEAQSVVAAWKLDAETAPTMQADIDGLLGELDDVYNGRREPILRTGIEALDAVIGGLQPTLTVVGSQPGVGKSALVAGICRNLALAQTHVGLVSLEDDRGWLVRRITSDFANVGIHSMLTKRLSKPAMEAIGAGAEKAHAIGRFVHIDGRGALTAPEVVASARAMLSRGCKAILVDHLGEVRVDTKSERHDLEIATALSQMRELAKTYRVPVVVCAHLRRSQSSGADAQYDEPKPTDFAFSAAIERMARVALGLYRVKDAGTGERDQHLLKCAILKQTQGVSGISVTLRLKPISAIVTDSPAPPAAKNLYEGEES